MSGALGLLLGRGATAGGGGGALAASPSGTFFSGAIVAPGTAFTTTCTITPSGGTAPYTYAWTRQSGDTSTTISSAAGSTVRWSRVFGAALQIKDSYWACTVTDAASAHVTISGIQAELERD